MRILPEAMEITKTLVTGLAERGGRAADQGLSLPFLLSMVAAAGDGDHIDIGALYGASAIGAALIKKELGLGGQVYCIDPYDAEKRALQVMGSPETPVSATAEELMANAEFFEVELKLIQQNSHPWPEELEDNVFASAYIDGDHTGKAPLNDFENLRGRTTGYIGTDNYEEEYPDVVSSMVFAMDTEDWFLYYKNLVFIALRRILPTRADPSAQVLAR